MKKAAFVLLLLILAGLIYLNRSDLKNLIGFSKNSGESAKESSASKNDKDKGGSSTNGTESPESTEATKPTTIDEDISNLEKVTLPGVDAQLNDNLQDIQL